MDFEIITFKIFHKFRNTTNLPAPYGISFFKTKDLKILGIQEFKSVRKGTMKKQKKIEIVDELNMNKEWQDFEVE